MYILSCKAKQNIPCQQSVSHVHARGAPLYLVHSISAPSAGLCLGARNYKVVFKLDVFICCHWRSLLNIFWGTNQSKTSTYFLETPVWAMTNMHTRIRAAHMSSSSPLLRNMEMDERTGRRNGDGKKAEWYCEYDQERGEEREAAKPGSIQPIASLSYCITSTYLWLIILVRGGYLGISYWDMSE